MEPTLVSLSTPIQPSGHWIMRSLIALGREHRLPTRVVRWLDRAWIGIGRPTKTIRAEGLRLTVRRLTADEFFVREVIVDRQYNPRDYEIKETDTVIDVGANVGAFTLWAAQLASRGRVIAVEPVADNFALLTRNIRLNDFAHVSVLQAAVRAERRQTAIHLSPEGTGHHSVFADLAAQSPTTESVSGVRLQDLFEQFHVPTCQFLKLDCEGAEFEILRGMPPDLFPRIEKLALEYHVRSLPDKRREADGLVSLLQERGYRVDIYNDVLGTNRGMIFARRE